MCGRENSQDMMDMVPARSSRSRLLILAGACAAAGWAAVWLPWWLARDLGSTRATNPIDGMQLVTLGLLAAIGVGAGLLAPRRGWVCALATLAVLPVLVLIDLVRDPTSHNLLPFELAGYAVLTGIPVVLALVSGSVRHRLTAHQATSH